MSAQLDKFAFTFFKLFAQYESMLKEKGFFQVDKSGNVFVDWNRFANEVIGKNFMTDLGVDALAADYILDQPPKKQVAIREKIVWMDVSPTEKSVQILFTYICRVRNNLFHGAKFNGTWFDPERSEALLKHSLTVLEHYRGKVGL